jgi:hypothetical protein
MGKRLEDLNLSDAPLPKPRQPPDERETNWYRFCLDIEELLGSGEYDWASETLEGILATVRNRRYVSNPQREAVQNITVARSEMKSRGNGRWSTRRYEGFRR